MQETFCFVLFSRGLKNDVKFLINISTVFQQKLPFSRKPKHHRQRRSPSVVSERKKPCVFFSFFFFFLFSSWSAASYLLIYDNGAVVVGPRQSNSSHSVGPQARSCNCKSSSNSLTPHHVWLSFLSFFLSIQIHSQREAAASFHIFAFFNNSDLLITTRQWDFCRVLWIFIHYFFSRHLVVVLSFRWLFHLPAGSPARRINVLFYSLGSKYPIEKKPTSSINNFSRNVCQLQSTHPGWVNQSDQALKAG